MVFGAFSRNKTTITACRTGNGSDIDKERRKVGSWEGGEGMLKICFLTYRLLDVKWWWVQLPSDNSKSSSASFSRISSGREPRSTIKSVIILILQRCYVWCMWWVRLLCVLLRYFFFVCFLSPFVVRASNTKTFSCDGWWCCCCCC